MALTVNDSVGGSRVVRISLDVVNATRNATAPSTGANGGSYTLPELVGVGALGLLVGVGAGAAVFRRGRPPARSMPSSGGADAGDGSPEPSPEDPEGLPDT